MHGFRKFMTDNLSPLDIEKISKMPCDDVYEFLKNKSMQATGHPKKLRDKIVRQYAWTLPCVEYIQTIKKHIITGQPLYDLMAGTGFVAKILKNNGIQTISSDINIITRKNKYNHKPTHDDVEEIDAKEKIKQFENPVNVLLSWVPFKSTLDYEIAKSLPSNSVLFVVGENQKGATGSEIFWDYVANDYKKLDLISIPQWEDMKDMMWVGKKK